MTEPALLQIVMCAGMFAAVIATLLAGFPVALTLAGTALLFAALGTFAGSFDAALLGAFPARLFAIMNSEILIAIPLFIFMGIMLERSRIAEDLLESISALSGSRPGGLAIAVCLVGALLAASTGMVGATVVTMALVSLPTMLRAGYSPAIAGGTVAAAGTLGQIIPPSIVLVVLGDQLASAWNQAQYELGNFAPDAMSVSDLFAGALIPGLLLVAMYITYLALTGWLSPGRVPATHQAAGANGAWLKAVLKTLIAPVVLIVAVLGSILAGLATPGEAAGLGAAGAILLASYRMGSAFWPVAGALALVTMLGLAAGFDLRLPVAASASQSITALALGCAALLITAFTTSLVTLYRRVDTDNSTPLLVAVTRKTVRTTSMIFLIVIGASLFALVFRGLGGDDVLKTLLGALPGGPVTLLIIVMIVMFLLGFVLDFLEIVYIIVPVVAPVLLTTEIAPGEYINPVWLGVMISINLQTSFLTPPMGFALFYLRGAAPAALSTTALYRGVIPFVIMQLLMLVLLWFFPGLATWLPGVS